MGNFTDGGTGSAAGQKRLTILMATAFIVLCMCFVSIILSDGSDSVAGDKFTDDGITYCVISESDATVEVFASGIYNDPVDISIPDTVEYDSVEYKVVAIENNAFAGQYNITSISIGDNVKTIGNSAFFDCGGITTVNLSDSVTSIGKEAFSGCYNIISISIPKGVTFLGEYIFAYCTGLTAIDVDVDNQVYSSVDGVLFNKDKTDILICPRNKTGEYSIPATVTSVANGVFQNCSLSSISFLGDTVSIGNNSFEDCDNLASISLPNSLTSIGVSAFNGCKVLTSITIPSGVRSLPDSAFYNCILLSSVSLPDDMTSIGEKAFMDCKALVNIDLPENLETIGACAFRNCVELESISIPDNVISIGSTEAASTNDDTGAFQDCTKLVSVIFGDNVQVIGQRAFSGCKLLTEVDLPDSVTVIGNYAFYRCYGLTSIIIPNNVTEIGYSAFEWCNYIASVTIGDGVETIKGMAFAYCKDVQTLVIGDNVSMVGTDAFHMLEDLAALTMPISLSLINEYNKYSLFTNSKGLVDITFTPGTGEGFADYDSVSNFQYDTLPWNYHNVLNSEVKKTFTLRFANDIDSLGAHDFEGFSFFDSDEVTPLSNTVTDLCGYVYIGTYDRMIRQAVDSYERTVSFDANGGTGTMEPITVLTFDRFYPACTFTPPSGESFLGWALTSDGDILRSPIGVSEDTILYAKWGVKKVTVTFIVDGSEYDVQEVDSGTVVNPPKDPMLEGYVFRGWSPDISDQVLDDAIFTAVFAKMVPITYLVDGKIVDEVIGYAEGDTVSVLERYSMEGYTVSEWYTEDVKVDEGQFILGSKDVTFTATSKVNQYSVIFKDHDGSIISEGSFDYGSSVIVPEDPSRIGYDFVDWDPEVPKTVPAKDSEFIATYEICVISIVYKVDGSTVHTDEGDYGSTMDVYATPAEKAGHTFVEWVTDDVTVTSGQFVLGADTVTFTAVFTVNKYSVIFKTYDGTSVISEGEFDYGSQIVVPDAPVRLGHIFVGWNPEVPETVPDFDTVYLAKYEVNYYTITYKVDGSVVDEEEYPFGTVVDVADTYVKEGYTVSGWYTDDVVVDNGQFILGAKDVTFTATSEVN